MSAEQQAGKAQITGVRAHLKLTLRQRVLEHGTMEVGAHAGHFKQKICR